MGDILTMSFFRRITVRKLTYGTCAIASVSFIYHMWPLFGSDGAGRRIPFSELKANHKFKTLTTEKLRKVAQRSDYSKFYAYLTPMLVPRVSGTDANRHVQKHITDSLDALGWSIETDRFQDQTPYGPKEFTNIIATHNPAAARKLTLACHFDSKYFPGEDFPGEDFIGATDSAVPCAMLLDLARSLDDLLDADNPKKVQDVTLQLMFFDGEEAFKDWKGTDNTYGSRHLAQKMFDTVVSVDREVSVREIETLDALVLLDLIGAKNPRFRSWFENTDHLFQRLQHIESRLLKSKLLAGLLSTQNVYFKSSYRQGGHIEDDHVPFLKKSVPVVHLISYPFPAVWHKISDNEDALNREDTENLNTVMRVFVTEYLRLL